MRKRFKTLLFPFPLVFEQYFLYTKIIYNNCCITYLNNYVNDNYVNNHLSNYVKMDNDQTSTKTDPIVKKTIHSTSIIGKRVHF